MTDKDPQLYSSGYERNRLDRYWTHPWMTYELLDNLSSEISGGIWEPAAGRGDMSRALDDWDFGHLAGHVYSSDIDMSEFNFKFGPGHEKSFLDEFEMPILSNHGSGVGERCRNIITNPPYSQPWRGIADDFVEHALKFMDRGECDFIAMLLRSEFRCGKSKRRQGKFGRCEHYMGELVLTTRPRWDYGDPDAPENAAPRHNFSWFLWRRNWIFSNSFPIQMFSYMPKGFKL